MFLHQTLLVRLYLRPSFQHDCLLSHPCLEQSIIYKRAVGFFSSTSMALVAKGLTALIRAGGKMQLVASPQLSDEDIEAITRGIKQKEQVITDVTKKELEQEFNEVKISRNKKFQGTLTKN